MIGGENKMDNKEIDTKLSKIEDLIMEIRKNLQ